MLLCDKTFPGEMQHTCLLTPDKDPTTDQSTNSNKVHLGEPMRYCFICSFVFSIWFLCVALDVPELILWTRLGLELRDPPGEPTSFIEVTYRSRNDSKTASLLTTTLTWVTTHKIWET